MDKTFWTNCRMEGCHRPLPLRLQKFGFCNPEHKRLHGQEKEYHTQTALAAFKREGEPNGGRHV